MGLKLELLVTEQSVGYLWLLCRKHCSDLDRAIRSYAIIYHTNSRAFHA
jgi:hypothetical protein